MLWITGGLALAATISLAGSGLGGWDEQLLLHARWMTLAAFFLVVAVPALTYWLPRRAQGRPFGLVFGGAASTLVVVLGLSSYWKCDGPTAAGWTALFNTLALFAGNVATPFGTVSAPCPAEMPIALEAARILAILVTLSAAVAALLIVFSEQSDRVRVRMSRRLVVATGLAPDSVEFMAALRGQLQGVQPARRGLWRPHHRGRLLVVVERDRGNALIPRLRQLGILVVIGSFDDEPGMRALLRPGSAARDFYLLSPDNDENIGIASQLARIVVPRRNVPLPTKVIVRIDDSWTAEVYRRGRVGATATVMFDTVGVEQVTAQQLVDTVVDFCPDRLVILGQTGLTQALLDELAQYRREASVLGKPDAFPVHVVAEDSEGVIQEHVSRQAWFGNTTLVELHPELGPPSVSRIAELIERDRRPAVLDTRAATDAALRFAQRLRFHASTASIYVPTTAQSRRRKGADLQTYFPSLLGPRGVPEDGWTRIARRQHEAYVAQYGASRLAEGRKPWEELSDFIRLSNYRAVTHPMILATLLGRTWLPSSDSAEPSPLTDAEIEKCVPLEHESWRAHHSAEGWKWAQEREDTKRRHNYLLPWTELFSSAEGPAARLKTRDTVKTAFGLLETLGYRTYEGPAADAMSVNAHGMGCRRFRRISDEVFSMEALQEPLTWTTSGGDRLTGQTGDYRVTANDGSEWTITAEAKNRTYLEVGPGRFVRWGHVRARRALPGEVVVSTEGRQTANVGDWVIRDVVGDTWLNSAEDFSKNYVPETSD